MKYLTVLTAAGLLLCAGCGSPILLEKDFVKRVAAPPDAESHIIYCNDSYTLTDKGTIVEKRNMVVRVGADPRAFPPVIMMEEMAREKITGIEGRVIHADGSTTHIGSSEFFKVNLSGKERIAEEYARAAGITDRLGTGDLVESAVVIEHSFPLLGIAFSPADLGYPSDNVSCTIETGKGEEMRYEVVNATIEPSVQNTETGRQYVFAFPPYRPPTKRQNIMLQENRWPGIYAAPHSATWQSFGDWYLTLVGDRLTPGKALSDTTARIVAGKSSPREKLDAIFDYCKGAIRYEQMYIANGEIVPNPADVIFSRRFGDCKDYATIMHAMAASAGIPTELALCYRGRGVKMFESFPSDVFNHVILHYTDNGKDSWYDATDRLGLSGTPSFDLANARALVVEQGRSRIVTIGESPQNLATVAGRLTEDPGHGVRGSLSLTFAYQYAVEFSWEQEHLNGEDMRASLTAVLRRALNDDIAVDSLDWHTTAETFVLNASCRIPNCLVALGGKTYTSPSRLFPNLLPDDVDSAEARKAFYCPYLNNVDMDVTIATPAEPLRLTLHYRLPAGPFDDASRAVFLRDLLSIHAEFARSRVIAGNGHP
ncbi:MAG TPA: transglutaminase-like domain-containing protein [Bacteroidota bacterium]|nr:transglutaminase-like domain-containing protein [Bacteroidota bacterium]